MQDGFHVYINGQCELVCAIIENRDIQQFQPRNIANSLIEYVKYDFSSYWDVVRALDELPIFKESLDIHEDDFVECKEICQQIAQGVEDLDSRYFGCEELEYINAIPDDSSAGYWIYQARRMVDSLMQPITAHTFVSRAFQLLYASPGTVYERVSAFFAAYPQWLDHAFAEGFTFIRQTDEPDTAVTIQNWKHIHTHEELFFFQLLELIRQNVRIQRCACCGQYFVPKTKRMTLYCDRVIRDEKTCKELAPTLKQRKLKRQDEALAEYDRLYKMYYARAERFENRTDLHRKRTDNDLTYDEFYLWSSRASLARKSYVQGELTVEEFLLKITLAGEVG